MKEVILPPYVRLVPKEVSDALAKRQQAAARALKRKWALHPDNAVRRKAS